ncbi:hypothetical protein, partial [Paraburkholderia sp. NMBU_R16]|uniref:hypothetical protein n=1 Tax=Paraburkholderia sp. NMBU_R16 TaxID=2698676 RepID=UPI001C274AC4
MDGQRRSKVISIGHSPARETNLRGQGCGRAKRLNCQVFLRRCGPLPIKPLVKLGGLTYRVTASMRFFRNFINALTNLDA